MSESSLSDLLDIGDSPNRQHRPGSAELADTFGLEEPSLLDLQTGRFLHYNYAYLCGFVRSFIGSL